MKTTSTRLAATTIAVVALGAGLTACGGGSSDGTSSSSSSSGGDYCKDLKKAKSDLGALSGTSSSADLSDLGDVFKTFDTLAAEAPSAVKSDWATLSGVEKTIEKAFDEAGIKMSDLPAIQKGQIPKGVDVSKLSQLSSTLSTLSSAKYTAASNAIEAHAKKVCGVDLSTS